LAKAETLIPLIVTAFCGLQFSRRDATLPAKQTANGAGKFDRKLD